MIWIWSILEVIKAVKSHFLSLTLDVNYLTLRAKIQNYASYNFCVWWLRTYIWVFSTLRQKNSNDLRDLEFDLVTLRSLGYVDLVYAYLWYEYDQDLRSLRVSKAIFQVWPWTAIIWPWGQKFKIPLPAFFAYGHKEHICAFLALSYQNCRRR